MAYSKQQLVQFAIADAQREGINPQIFRRQINQESGFNPRARSYAGALGIAQIVPKYHPGVDPMNPVAALAYAAHMDAANLKKYGNWRDTLSIYNSGRGWSVGRNIGQTNNYVRSILGGLINGAVNARPTGAMNVQAPKNILPGVVSSGSDNRAAIRAFLSANLGSFAATGHVDPMAGSNLIAALQQGSPANKPQDPAAQMGTTPHSVPAAGRGGITEFGGKPVAAWIAGVLGRARAAGWTGQVESGYRSVAEQRRIYNSGVRPAALPGKSNHNFTAYPGGAVDVTQAAQLAAVLRRLGINKLQWAGAKDPVHFSHPHNGGY